GEDAQALELLGLLARLTAEGIDALEAGNDEALPALLDRRQAVIDRADAVFRRPAGGGAAIAGARREAGERSARALAAEEARLVERMAARRDLLAAELEQVESGAVARAAYASAPRAHALDLKR